MEEVSQAWAEAEAAFVGGRRLLCGSNERQKKVSAHTHLLFHFPNIFDLTFVVNHCWSQLRQGWGKWLRRCGGKPTHRG